MSLLFWIFFQARPITAHDLLHINAVITDCDELLVMQTENPQLFDKHADGYEVNPNRLGNLLSNIKRNAEQIRDSGEIPEEYADRHPADLGDILKEFSR